VEVVRALHYSPGGLGAAVKRDLILQVSLPERDERCLRGPYFRCASSQVLNAERAMGEECAACEPGAWRDPRGALLSRAAAAHRCTRRGVSTQTAWRPRTATSPLPSPTTPPSSSPRCGARRPPRPPLPPSVVQVRLGDIQRCKNCDSDDIRVWHRGDRNWSLNDGQIPNCRGERVHVRTGYNHAGGNRRALRNGRASDPPPETPTVSIRHLSIAVRHPRGVASQRRHGPPAVHGARHARLPHPNPNPNPGCAAEPPRRRVAAATWTACCAWSSACAASPPCWPSRAREGSPSCTAPTCASPPPFPANAAVTQSES
jgi:hypothetical protein